MTAKDMSEEVTFKIDSDYDYSKKKMTVGELIKQLIDASEGAKYGMKTEISCSAEDIENCIVSCEIKSVDNDDPDCMTLKIGSFSC